MTSIPTSLIGLRLTGQLLGFTMVSGSGTQRQAVYVPAAATACHMTHALLIRSGLLAGNLAHCLQTEACMWWLIGDKIARELQK